jgi:7,8-dihydroneopterin aldolase/epimerase/oxygenase
MKIYIEDLKIYAYHGLFESEKANGQMFEIQCCIDFELDEEFRDSIELTLDYVEIYNIITSQMAIRSNMLEDVVIKIHRQIMAFSKRIKFCELKITKLSPPIEGMDGKVSVSF